MFGIPFSPIAMPTKRRKVSVAADATRFTDLPNVGPATAHDFVLLGFSHPRELAGQNPYALYDRLCKLTHSRQDPCVADVFIAAVRFMEGSPPHDWWHYTDERKAEFAKREFAKREPSARA